MTLTLDTIRQADAYLLKRYPKATTFDELLTPFNE